MSRIRRWWRGASIWSKPACRVYIAIRRVITTPIPTHRRWIAWVRASFLAGHAQKFPGEVYAPNITPAALKDWTDGELYRVITTGVRKDGEPLFPIMPYTYYSKLDPKDVEAVIAYLRTMKPVENTVPKAQLDFPLNLIVRTIPTAATPMRLEDHTEGAKLGEYLVTTSACMECHTPADDKGTLDLTKRFAGTREFILPDGSAIFSSNITPHKTGIGGWSEDQFVQRFAMYRADSALVKVADGDFNTLMPWKAYSDISNDDLRAIYQYLRTVPAVDNPNKPFVSSKDVAVK